MQEIEVKPQEWKTLKNALMNGTVDRAMRGFPSPVKVYCGKEFVIYERGDDSDAEERQR